MHAQAKAKAGSRLKANGERADETSALLEEGTRVKVDVRLEAGPRAEAGTQAEAGPQAEASTRAETTVRTEAEHADRRNGQLAGTRAVAECI